MTAYVVYDVKVCCTLTCVWVFFLALAGYLIPGGELKALLLCSVRQNHHPIPKLPLKPFRKQLWELMVPFFLLENVSQVSLNLLSARKIITWSRVSLSTRQMSFIRLLHFIPTAKGVPKRLKGEAEG